LKSGGIHGRLIQDCAGNLYGTALFGVAPGPETVERDRKASSTRHQQIILAVCCSYQGLTR
jgi:hypothetical protein